ncbi:MAG TPA: ABC transporter permease subunit, partial [Gaiellaceae bacterium]
MAPGARFAAQWFPPAALVVLLLGTWEAAVRVRHTPDYLLPAPSAIGSALLTDRAMLGRATLVTLGEVLLGYALGVAVALLVASAIHFSTTLRRALLPLLVLSQTIPIVVVAPILTILLGFALAPKVVIVGLVCFFPIVVNAVDGLRSADAAQL